MRRRPSGLIVLDERVAHRSRSRARLCAKAREERGQALVLAIGLCAITLLTVSVVLAASAVNLKARQLLSMADGAAVAAVDEFEFVAGAGAPRIELSADRVRQGAQKYLSDIGAGNRIDDLGIASVVVLPGGQGAELVLTATVSPPIVGWIVPGGIPITVHSTAQTVLSR